MKMKLHNSVSRSLTEQLSAKGADIEVFSDLLRDYMSLWKVKEYLVADILKRGVVYEDVSSIGVTMKKNNPSVRELNSTIKQMQSLLKDLGLTVNSVIAGKGEPL
jgi:phage terminase small subunit